MDTNQALIEAQRIATFGTLAGALVGGVIGFLGSWIVTHINAKAEWKRQLLQLGHELGIKQWESTLSILQRHADQGRKIKMVPTFVYVNFNVRVLELLADGKLTPESLQKLHAENNKIIQVIDENSKIS
ncbi:MAG: hypothetical protein C4557_01175 [Anaerolineaceae bacterium]|jgi:hypothetical protein|nr:MAG: hypothetical protein C4557_01175 [Anaerolineaceae bacterium]